MCFSQRRFSNGSEIQSYLFAEFKQRIATMQLFLKIPDFNKRNKKFQLAKHLFSFHYLYIKIGCGSAQSSLKTVFSLASTLAFHYICCNKVFSL